MTNRIAEVQLDYKTIQMKIDVDPLNCIFQIFSAYDPGQAQKYTNLLFSVALFEV